MWLRRRRRVRIHLVDAAPSLEGYLVGLWRQHYVLALPELVEAPDRTIALEGQVRVPAGRVLFIQEL